MQTAKRTVGFCWGILFLLFAGVVLACPNAALSQLRPQPKPTNLSVTITPRKATLFAGETQVFVATVVGGGDRTVAWSVDEEDGGTVTSFSLLWWKSALGYYPARKAAYSQPRGRTLVQPETAKAHDHFLIA